MTTPARSASRCRSRPASPSTPISWNITNAGTGFSRSGTVNVQNSNTIRFQVGGLPAGAGYTVNLTATTVDGAFSCAGSAGFSVAAGMTNPVMLTLTCMANGNGVRNGRHRRLDRRVRDDHVAVGVSAGDDRQQLDRAGRDRDGGLADADVRMDRDRRDLRQSGERVSDVHLPGDARDRDDHADRVAQRSGLHVGGTDGRGHLRHAEPDVHQRLRQRHLARAARAAIARTPPPASAPATST